MSNDRYLNLEGDADAAAQRVILDRADQSAKRTPGVGDGTP